MYVVTIHLDDDRIDPRHMYDANGVIEKNIAPIKLSEWRETHKREIEIFETNLQKDGTKLVHI